VLQWVIVCCSPYVRLLHRWQSDVHIFLYGATTDLPERRPVFSQESPRYLEKNMGPTRAQCTLSLTHARAHTHTHTHAATHAAAHCNCQLCSKARCTHTHAHTTHTHTHTHTHTYTPCIILQHTATCLSEQGLDACCE